MLLENSSGNKLYVLYRECKQESSRQRKSFGLEMSIPYASNMVAIPLQYTKCTFVTLSCNSLGNFGLATLSPFHKQGQFPDFPSCILATTTYVVTESAVS